MTRETVDPDDRKIRFRGLYLSLIHMTAVSNTEDEEGKIR